MKTTKKLLLVPAVLLLVVFASCSTTGEYMPLSKGETVIGTVQDTLVVKSTFFSMKSVRNSINTEAYIKLLEAAEKKYPGNIDIRDIVWVTGRNANYDPTSTEVFVAGKVIRIGPEPAAQRPGVGQEAESATSAMDEPLEGDETEN